MARTKKEEAPESDRDACEYATYAPGHTYSARRRKLKLKPLEVAVRGAIERASGAPVIVHRHDRCPKTEAVAA
ncbi:hypothetical protein GCM10010232_12980 [Streptomyces amakusaensis]